MWPVIPKDVLDHVRHAFRRANRKVCEVLLNVPNERETTLDGVFVDALIPESAPMLLASGAIVEMDIHNIGGLRRFARWETADIAVLVFVHQGQKLLGQKAGFLQSKRLYPTNHDVKDDDPVGFMYGLNGMLWKPPIQPPPARIRRSFDFDDSCRYGALKAGDEQIDVIEDFNAKFGEAIYYLLYSPPKLPVQLSVPQTHRLAVSTIDHGCRVIGAQEVHGTLSGMAKGQSPTYRALHQAAATSNWPIEVWASDLLLSCKVGRAYGDSDAEMVRNLIERRTGPISATIAVSVTIPEGD